MADMASFFQIHLSLCPDSFSCGAVVGWTCGCQNFAQSAAC